MNKHAKMRLFTLFSLLLFFGSFNLYAQEQLMTINVENASLIDVLNAIEKQTTYRFSYRDGVIDNEKNVTISLKDVSVNAVLDEALKGRNLSYSVVSSKSIVISEKKAEPNVDDSKQKRIVGKVFDENGEPIPGADIGVQGSTRGVATDVDGSFAIDVKPTDKLIVSYLGMEQQVVTVGELTVINIKMAPKSNELDAVTVVAFGKQKKESVLASIATVKPSELKVPSSNLTTAFAGRIAGVIAYQRSGEPGQDKADFFIRGITTFGTGKVDPLILIDGVELSSEDLARLNTDDIASFSVMKDANATALYGARGANGVILVTTKEGTEGKAKLSVRIENSFSSPTQKVGLADPVTYMILGNEAARTRDPLAVIPYSDEKIANTGTGNPYVYPATDWMGMMFKNYTSNQRVNMNLSGGGKVERYYIAASFNQDNGILNVDKRNNFNSNINLKEYLLRTNININLTPTTEMIFRLHGTFDDYKGPIDGGTDLYNKVMRANPVLFPAYYAPDQANRNVQHILFGNSGIAASYLNPYADMVKGYKDYSKTLVLAQLELKQDLNFLLKGLSVRGMFNTTRYSYFDVSRFYNPYYYMVGGYNKYTDTYTLSALNPKEGTEYLGYSEGQKDVNSTVYYELAAQYANTFAKDHNVSAMLIYTGREELKGNAGDLQQSLPFRNLGLAGRLTYDYKGKYYIEGNFGYNGSERFAPSHRFGFFPSIGGGYVISNEPFWDPWKNTISKVKLRATYGLVGNDQIGLDTDRFFYLSNVNLEDGGRGMSFGTDFSNYQQGVSISRYEDTNIGWEVAYKQNYAIELGLFNNIEIIAEYFKEKRTNILQYRASIPSTMGLQATPQANIGAASGSGVDISLDYSKILTPDLWLTVRGNFTYAVSKYLKYEEPDYSATPWLRHVGQNLSQHWGYVAERLFVDNADAANSPPQLFGEYSAGDIKYKDINGDDVIDNRDQVPIGYPTTPEIVYGIGFSLGYKSFDFSTFFQGSALSSFWINAAAISPYASSSFGGRQGQNALMQVIADSHWSEDNRNTNAFWPRLSDHIINNNAQGVYIDENGMWQWSENNTWFMRDGSFCRLKTAELGYTLPKKLLQKAHVGMLRLYLSGTNLLTFSKFKLWDPEMAGNGLGYPVQRVLNVGLNVNF